MQISWLRYYIAGINTPTYELKLNEFIQLAPECTIAALMQATLEQSPMEADPIKSNPLSQEVNI